MEQYLFLGVKIEGKGQSQMQKTPIFFTPQTDLSVEEIKKLLEGKFALGERIVVKLHFGEPGNKTALHPAEVRPWVEALNELGHQEVLLFDCPVFYPSERDSKEGYEKSIAEQGWNEIGAQTEVGDEYETVMTREGEIKIAKILTEAKNLLILSHVKGHQLAGFGGAIKNIGIGAVAPETKGFVHGFDPRAERTSNAGKFQWLPERIGLVVAETAQKMPAGRTVFVNLMKRMTKRCDCAVDSGKILLEDMGTMIGDNIVAIDQASLDMINEKAGRNIFLEANKMDPESQIEWTARESGLSREYELVK